MQEEYDAFTQKMFCELLGNQGKENVVISPYSILILMAIAVHATSGATRDEIVHAILSNGSYEDLEALASGLIARMSEADGICISSAAIVRADKGDSIRDTYAEQLKSIFDGELLVDEDLIRRTNDWVNGKTSGMIPKIVDESMKDALMCLVNAILFQKEWAAQYEEDDIEENEKFTNVDGSTSHVTMLVSREDDYVENQYFTGFVKPYKSGFSYMALLPVKEGNSFLLKALKDTSFSALYADRTSKEVYVNMPEFAYEFEENLEAACKKFGIKTLFKDSADFSNMSNTALKIKGIIHKAKIEVDRQGTRAAAVTAGIAYAGSAPDFDNFREVVLDRPFVYAIIHEGTGIPVFVGTVNQLPDEKRTHLDADLFVHPSDKAAMTTKKKDESLLPFTYEIYVPEQYIISKRIAVTNEIQLIPASYQPPEQEDVVDVQFDASVLEADKWDYLVAAASGLVAAMLNSVFVGELSLTEASSWGRKETDKFVMSVAHAQGYKGNDLSDAIQHLEKLFPIPSDKVTAEMGGGLQHHLRDFAHHPTLAGLAFSILSQFTKCSYGTNAKGEFITVPIPDGDYFGENICEKLFNGTAIWAFHLISDMAGSSDNAGAGTGIPGCILSFLKEVSALPVISELKVKYKDDDIGFSVWISKAFNGTLFRTEDNPRGIRFDLRTEMGVAYQLGKQAIPVIVNECIVRCFYLIRRLYLEISRKEAHSLHNIANLDPAAFLPFNNRTITHMTTVSSGIFLAVTTSAAAVRAEVKSKGDKDNKGAFTKGFLLYVNYAGVARFGFAINAEAKYVVKDIKKIYQEYHKRRESINEHDIDFKALEYLSLTAEQAAILHSLEFFKVQYDIQNEKDAMVKAQKEKWLDAWVESNGSAWKSCLIADEPKIYEAILHEIPKGHDLTWLYLIALELSVFHPYFQMTAEDVSEYKGLKCKADYEQDKFCKMQMIISAEDYSTLTEAYQKSISDLNGQKKKLFVGMGATAAIAAVTGGVALAFAPEIAVALAGQSFVGLYGAALTSASLAAIGGGSLAVGGLGMAGGTAIITGGGALLGMIGSGAITATSLSLLSSKAYVLNECAKLLTVCRFILIGMLGRKDAVAVIARGVDAAADKLGYDLDERNPDGKFGKEEKAGYKEQQACLSCLQKCSKLLKKLSAD